MVSESIKKLFKNSSQTFFNSSGFFPPETKDEVTLLYSFVRKADDFVDSVPQNAKEFLQFKEEYKKARKTLSSEDIIIDSFVKLEKRKNFDSLWSLKFLEAMELDLIKKNYQTIEETEEYIFGSACVVGLFMAKIMNLPKESYPYAELLGKSFQFINFIRDIGEDIQMQRNYFPIQDMEKFGLKSLSFEETNKKRIAFKQFIDLQLERYRKWQEKAEKGFLYIPYKYLIPIKTASDMYKWTSKVIKKDPFIVYREKVKPTVRAIKKTGLKNSIQLKVLH